MDKSKILSELMMKLEPFATSLSHLTQNFSKPLRQKLILVINHVIAQNAEAVERMKVYSGRTVVFESPFFDWPLVITSAGLLDENAPIGAVESHSTSLAKINLRVKVQVSSMSSFMESLLNGMRPLVDMDGDADLVATFAWLSENLRWDYENDLSRIIGDSPIPIAVDQLKEGVELFRGILDSMSDWLSRNNRSL